MLFLLYVLLFCIFPSQAVNITGVGSATYFPIIKAWADSYRLLVPDFYINFETSATGPIGIAQLAAGSEGNKSIDFVLADGTLPNASQYLAGIQVFPFLITTIVAQINLGNGYNNIRLNGSELGEIFMGNITNWSDPKIAETNPGVPLPNETIQVFYRSDPSSTTSLWLLCLRAWSPAFAAANFPYGLVWPKNLTDLPNFYGFPSLLALNGAIAGIPYSIGYAQYYAVTRDPGLHYAHQFNKWSGKEVTPSSLITDQDFMKLNTRLETVAVINPPTNDSWPLVATVYLDILKKPGDCAKAREFYKFIRWALTAEIPRQQTIRLGCIPLSDNITNVILTELQKIQCDGKGLGAYTVTNESDATKKVLFSISVIVLFLALVLSAMHMYHFRSSLIYLIYTTVFVLGTIITLISPIFWFIDVTMPSTCQGRIWTMSLGFSIMLGTMFSRTWQLQEIYYLQKRNMEALKRKISTNKTYVQLAVTLIGVIFVNFIILVAWSIADPLTAKFKISDQIQLSGYWTCECNNPIPWLLVSLFFFLSLLCFGIYVIYDTWSFQRAVALTETRWVLFALYNVILNFVAIIPILTLSAKTDDSIAYIAIASTDLSAGSIACAVLLPRVLQNFQWSKSSKISGTKSPGHPQSPHPETSLEMRGKSHRSHSRTPEDELAKKLEEPRPLRFASSAVELQTLTPTKDAESHVEPTHDQMDIDCPSGHPSPERADSPSAQMLALIAEHPEDSPHPSPHRDSLNWSTNPIKEAPDS